ENQVQIGDSPVGDEALPAIYDPFVPPPDRPGPDGAEIGAGPRLGKADGPEAGLLRIAQESEPPSLLLLRPEPVDQPGGQGGHAEGSGHPGASPAQLLRDDAGGEEAVDAPSQVFLRKPVGDEAGPVGLFVHLPGKAFLLVALGGHRPHLLFGEPAGQPLHLTLLIRHLKGNHGDFPPSTMPSSIKRSISSRRKPISWRISTVCSPRRGAGVTGFPSRLSREDKNPLLGIT